jgi:hypothetical protein
MDGRRFDVWTMAWSGPASRRAALKGAAGAALGGLVALLGKEAAAAGICRRAGRPCAQDDQCCGKCGRARGQCKATPRGTCRGENYCTQLQGQPVCNSSLACFCYLTQTGASFCGRKLNCANSCTTDADWVARTGPGSACVQGSGIVCDCPGGRTCAAPCQRA